MSKIIKNGISYAGMDNNNDKVTQIAINGSSGDYYLLMSPQDNSSTETTTATKFKGLYFYNGTLTVGDGEYGDETYISDDSVSTKFIQGTTRVYAPSIIGNDITCNSMSVQDISDQYTFTRTSGPWTYQGVRAVRSGNVVTMQIIIKGGTSVSAGSNGIQGTFSGGPLPAKTDNGSQAMGIYGINFYGVSALVGTLNSNGDFILRLLIHEQSLGSNVTSIGFTFVCD